ncbi:MAG: transposase [Chloroflexota bacterium]|nr:MAG: transposase [Chloroflexota bacterium]
MSKRRKFSPEFKSQVVLQLLSGEQSMAELCRAHQLTSQTINNWKQQLVASAPQAFKQGIEVSSEQERIAELERMVGKLTMELEIAKKASHLLAGMHERNGRQR